MADEIDIFEERTHYHFLISLRVMHPDVDPQSVTEALGIEPARSWKAGEDRRTPKGRILGGVNRNTYWTARFSEGRWPLKVDHATHDVLRRLVPHRSYFHALRSGGGTNQLFIGPFFENQSWDVLSYQCLALAGDLQIDLAFDIYPPEQPQNEHNTPAASRLEVEPPVQKS